MNERHYPWKEIELDHPLSTNSSSGNDGKRIAVSPEPLTRQFITSVGAR